MSIVGVSWEYRGNRGDVGDGGYKVYNDYLS